MKRRISIIASLLLLFVIVFASCSSPVKFDISFVSDGEVIATITTTGDEVIQMPQNPTKEGYTFGGWYWDNGTWQRPFTVNSILNEPLTSNMSVYAKWVPDGDVVTVDFVYDNQGTEKIDSYTVFKGEALGSTITKMPAPEREGYRISGWQDKDGNIVRIDTVINNSMTLYPIWQQKALCVDGTENHTWSDWQTKGSVATCTEDVSIVRSCAACGSFEYDILTNALGHDFGDPVEYLATCANGGYLLYTCRRCGETEKRDETAPDPSKHKYVLIDTTATCEESGYSIYSCETCQGTRHSPSDALGHNFQLTDTVKATCVLKGYDLYTCTRCDAEEKRNITNYDNSPNGHNYLPDTKEPTCTKSGYTDMVCEYCGSGDGNRLTLPKLGHTYEREDYDGTTGKVIDYEAGTVTYYCQDCDQAYTRELEEDEIIDHSQKWKGQTLDILANGWGADSTTTGLWSQPELYVNADNYNTSINMGARINSAVWARQKAIEEAYGVTLKWHRAKSNASMQNEMQSGLGAGYAKYHIAMPRGYEAQALIAANTVYDLANSEYIDLTKPYYNQASVDSFSVYGHTFYVAGDFSYLDEFTSFVVYYNQKMTDDIENFPNLFDAVENGTWTIAELSKWASLVGADNDGQTGYQDTDTYGFGTASLTSFFQSSGIQQVSVDRSSENKSEHYYRITINDDSSSVSELVKTLVGVRDSTWARTSWDGGYATQFDAFKNGRLLFYHEVTQKMFTFSEPTTVLPVPKLNVDQESYHTPFATQGTVMCIPRCTTDREMSEYFFDVLSSTGQEYVMSAFYQEINSKLYDEENIDIVKNYIFSSLSYDQGYIYEAMGQRLMTSVQSDTISNATLNSSPFTTYYLEQFPNAKDKVDEWNTKAKNYKD